MKETGILFTPENYTKCENETKTQTKLPDGFYRFLNDPKGGNPDEWPGDLRVREFPR